MYSILVRKKNNKKIFFRLLALALTQGFFGAVSFIAALLAVSYMPVADALGILDHDPSMTHDLWRLMTYYDDI